MQKPLFKLIIALALAVLFSVPPCWAKEEGYCYVVSYSLREKVFFYSPVFTAVGSGEV